MQKPHNIPEILAILENQYGRAEWFPRFSPIEELVQCILSQHTSDTNSLRAFANLMQRYRTWQSVVDAPVKELADTIRTGGLADSKAPRIQAVLRQIKAEQDDYNLDFLEDMSDTEARKRLMALPGVGPKTAAIVLCFAMGRPVIPVDTHIFRVAWRLGLIEKRIGEAKAHDALQALVPPELVFRFHVGLITHGRQICKALNPRCGVCPLTAHCQAYQSATEPSSGS